MNKQWTMTLVVGADFYQKVRLRVKATGQPVNLEGATLRLCIRPLAPGAEIELMEGSGLTVIGPRSAGEIDITYPKASIAPITWDHGSFGFFITETNGRTRRRGHGPVTVDRAGC